VTVPWAAAIDVFDNNDVPKWAAITRRTFPNCDLLSLDSFGSLVSLFYNRGAALMTDFSIASCSGMVQIAGNAAVHVSAFKNSVVNLPCEMNINGVFNIDYFVNAQSFGIVDANIARFSGSYYVSGVTCNQFAGVVYKPRGQSKIASLSLALLVRSQAANTVSQPSSLVRAVSSDTLSVGA
jgi:hypothetical protein